MESSNHLNGALPKSQMSRKLNQKLMKKLCLKSVIAISIIALFSSCMAMHSGYMSNSAALSSANFSYVTQNIKGKSTATYILGIGGLAKETLVDNAKKQMLESNPLKSNQVLANLTVNFKTSLYFGYIYKTVTCTVTADIVQFK